VTFDSSASGHALGIRVCFVPPHPSPLPEERESAGTVLDNSDVAVVVPAAVRQK